jgi:hypothetical protein
VQPPQAQRNRQEGGQGAGGACRCRPGENPPLASDTPHPVSDLTGLTRTSPTWTSITSPAPRLIRRVGAKAPVPW